MSKTNLIAPYGGELVDLIATAEERTDLLELSSSLSSIKINQRALHDLEMIATGAFSPLDRFMGKADYERVLHEMRLADGTLFPLPITLTANPDELPSVGSQLVLRNALNDVIAIMTSRKFIPGALKRKLAWLMAQMMPVIRWFLKWLVGARFVFRVR